MLNLVQVLEKLRPDLLEGAQARRAGGLSLDAIAVWLGDEAGLPVSREAVRRYFKTLGESTRPRGPNKAKVPVPFAAVLDDPAYDEVVRVAPAPAPAQDAVVDPGYQNMWNAARKSAQ